MAKAGQSISNPLSGQRLVFRTTARDTGGSYLEFEWFVEPFAGKYPPEHVHRVQVEQFDIISGRAKYRRGGLESEAGPGDTVDFPTNVPHIHPWSESDEPLHMRQITRCLHPNLRLLEAIEAVAETGFGLARDGKVGRDGLANVLQTAVLAEAVLPDVHQSQPPLAVQRVAVAILAPIGRFVGYRVQYPRYAGVSS
jgi:mannose-6-phosphate isomerase-like protein (cupin superfamily)